MTEDFAAAAEKDLPPLANAVNRRKQNKKFNKMWRKRKQFGNAVAIRRKSCYNRPDPLRSSCAE